MIKEISENDWKLFREKLTTWQDTYIDKLNQEYIEILSSSDNPTDKFWKAYQYRQTQDRCSV